MYPYEYLSVQATLPLYIQAYCARHGQGHSVGGGRSRQASRQARTGMTTGAGKQDAVSVLDGKSRGTGYGSRKVTWVGTSYSDGRWLER